MENHGNPSNETICIYILPDILNQHFCTRIGTKLFYFYVAIVVVLSILLVRHIVLSNILVFVPYCKHYISLPGSSFFVKRLKFYGHTNNRTTPTYCQSFSLGSNSSYFITAHNLSDWLCYSIAWHSLIIMACQRWSVHLRRMSPIAKILQLLWLSHLICVLQRRGALYPLRFIIPAVTSRSFCSSFSNHLFINARYHLDPVGRDSAPRRRGDPTLVATAQPIVCQNCLTFASLVWRTCYRAHLVASMALNALRLLSCFKRLIPHWTKILVPFN
jgi:hypothetical protein